MFRISPILLGFSLLSLSAQDQPVPPERDPATNLESQEPQPAEPKSEPAEPVPATPEVTPTPEEPTVDPEPKPEPKPTPPTTEDLFTKGLDLGRVGDKPTGSFRRIVQRTIMPTEPRPVYGGVLTFDDQILPMAPEHASAMEIAKDLQLRGARAIFFANVPAVSSKSLRSIFKIKDREKQKKKCLALLQSQRSAFIKGVRELIRMKKDDVYICEVHNHTAFHQDMKRFKAGTAKMDLCLLGIRFIDECLDEAYEAERPGEVRTRYFRFPFLHVPRDAKAKAELNKLFTELGLISLGETQDSKDFTNGSSKRAQQSLIAAQKNKRYSVRHGAYGRADEPICLFHTKTWRKIKPGVLRAIDNAQAAAKAKEVAIAPKVTEEKPVETIPTATE